MGCVMYCSYYSSIGDMYRRACYAKPFDQRGDDCREGGAENDPDREVDDIAAHDEGPEFLPHAPLRFEQIAVVPICRLRDDSTQPISVPIEWRWSGWPR